MKLYRLSPIWWCYYIIVCYELQYSKPSPIKRSRVKIADSDYNVGRRMRRMTKQYNKLK